MLKGPSWHLQAPIDPQRRVQQAGSAAAAAARAPPPLPKPVVLPHDRQLGIGPGSGGPSAVPQSSSGQPRGSAEFGESPGNDENRCMSPAQEDAGLGGLSSSRGGAGEESDWRKAGLTDRINVAVHVMFRVTALSWNVPVDI